MLTGIYCSTTGLNALAQKMDTISNNIANVNTEGFKQQKVSFKPFLREINGAQTAGRQVDNSPGSIKETGRELDFAISGAAFFTVLTAQGERYIRNGSFNCDEFGYLQDRNGNKIKGVSGEVSMVDGRPDQKFALVSIANQESLLPQTDGFVASAQTQITEVDYEVSQGRLETSNVDLISNFADLITTSRYYALNTKMLMSLDEMMKKAANEVGVTK